MNKLLILLVLFAAGGGSKVDVNDLILEINSSGKITDKQAESLSKVWILRISEACQPLIDKYK